MEAIRTGKSPIVTVMPTGGGKSMLFMLPAWIVPGGTTVVVVPLTALRDDMMDRCTRAGIRCSEWSVRQPPDGETVVFVTPESAVGDEFMTFLNRLKAVRRLDRIVIDECHVILDDQVDFRRRLQQLGKLMMAETQMVLLTATLPVREESKLYGRMGWQAGEVVKIRGRTTRVNIAYRIVRVSKQRSVKVQEEAQWDEVERVVERVVQQVVQQEGQGKVVIYCRTVAQVKQLGTAGGFDASDITEHAAWARRGMY